MCSWSLILRDLASSIQFAFIDKEKKRGLGRARKVAISVYECWTLTVTNVEHPPLTPHCSENMADLIGSLSYWYKPIIIYIIKEQNKGMCSLKHFKHLKLIKKCIICVCKGSDSRRLKHCMLMLLVISSAVKSIQES